MDNIKKVFSIHFPGKQVYVNSTFKKTLEEKVEQIKNDKDHILYKMLKEYPNPEIREEGYINAVSAKEVVDRYYKDWYKILNVNVFPPNYKKKKILN